MTIVSIDHIRNKGRAAALRGDKRDSHGMNWLAAALPHWLSGFDSVKQASPASHGAPAGRGRVDAAQAVAS
jgi:hypothetical protein